MPSSTTELIKEKLDIVDFLRGYLQLGPAGKNFKALCPFHREKTPSFMVSPERQSWHCFGCGLGGDIFGFLMRFENLEFGEALRVLAEKAGVELRRLNPAEYRYTELLYGLNDAAKNFFRSSLGGFEPAKKYLAERGLAPETIEEFEIGWAPNEPEALSMYLLNSGHSPEDLLRAGLVVKTDRGLLLDRFRGRIMFPIHNHFGRVVGFTGRVLPTQQTNADLTQNYAEDSRLRQSASSRRESAIAKYVNSPETPIFNKSRLLYGFFKSKNFIRDARSVFLVEGQMDFLMSWQVGVKNIVASSGTALTADHLKVLRRLTEEVVLSFDADEAGSAASERAIDLAEANDFSVKVAILDGFKDPAEAAQAGAENLRSAISKAVPAPEFYFEKYLPQAGLDGYSRREGLRNLRLLLAKIVSIASPVEQSFWLKELSRRTGIEDKVLSEEAERINVGKSSMEKAPSEASAENDAASLAHLQPASRSELIGEHLLMAAAARSDVGFLSDIATYLSQDHQRLFAALREGRKSIDDQRLDNLLNFIILGARDSNESEVSELKRELLKEHLKGRRQTLAAAVRKAEELGDESALKSALEELNSTPSPVLEL